MTATQPDFKHCALITIDVQKDTLDGGSLEVPGTSAILPKLTQLVTAFRKYNYPIIHFVRIYKPDGSNVDICRRDQVAAGAQWFLPDTDGVQLAPEIKPNADIFLASDDLLAGKLQTLGPAEYILYKSRWGAFYETPLQKMLEQWQINSLVFSGCNFPNCPRTSIYEASERDFKIVLATDAISGLYDQGIRELMNIGVNFHSVQEIVDCM
jgi:nicotinamidase-related amidase